MAINEKHLVRVNVGIYVLLVLFMGVYALVTSNGTSAGVNELIKGNATVVLSVVAAAITLFVLYINQHNHNELIRLSQQEKQLEELYFPLKYGLKYSHKIDIERIEKYSHLATGSLKLHIDSFIERKEMTDEKDSNVISDSVMLSAVELDIEMIKEALEKDRKE